MNNKERVLELLEQIAKDQAELRQDVNGINTLARISEMNITTLKNDYETLRSDVTRIQHDLEKTSGTQDNLVDHVDILRSSVTHLEYSVMHELKLLNENLPDAVARHELVEDLEAKVQDLNHRVFALEQAANK